MVVSQEAASADRIFRVSSGAATAWTPAATSRCAPPPHRGRSRGAAARPNPSRAWT